MCFYLERSRSDASFAQAGVFLKNIIIEHFKISGRMFIFRNTWSAILPSLLKSNHEIILLYLMVLVFLYFILLESAYAFLTRFVIRVLLDLLARGAINWPSRQPLCSTDMKLGRLSKVSNIVRKRQKILGKKCQQIITPERQVLDCHL